MSTHWESRVIFIGKKEQSDWRTAVTIRKFFDEKRVQFTYREPQKLGRDDLKSPTDIFAVVVPPAHNNPTLTFNPQFAEKLGSFLHEQGGKIWVPWELPKFGLGVKPPTQQIVKEEKSNLLESSDQESSTSKNREAESIYIKTEFGRVSVLKLSRGEMVFSGKVLARETSESADNEDTGEPLVMLEKVNKEASILATNCMIDLSSFDLSDKEISYKRFLSQHDIRRTLFIASIFEKMKLPIKPEFSDLINKNRPK